MKYEKHRVLFKLTLIPAFYHLPYPNFRLKRRPARIRQHAINQLSVTLT